MGQEAETKVEDSTYLLFFVYFFLSVFIKEFSQVVKIQETKPKVIEPRDASKGKVSSTT